MRIQCERGLLSFQNIGNFQVLGIIHPATIQLSKWSAFEAIGGSEDELREYNSLPAGKMMSTPIINPPQVGILGLHKIADRPVVENGQVVVKPMMYVALTYDHRLVDGRESVQFLVKVKEFIEDPAAMMLE